MIRPDPTEALAGKVLTTFYRRLLFLTRSLDKPIPDLRSQFPVEMRLLTTRDLEAYCVFRPDHDTERIKARLVAGHQCHVSWHEGRIVDAAWCAMECGPVTYFGRDLIVGPGDVFVYDAWTLPSHRAHNLFMAKVAHIFRSCKAEGFARNVAVVAFENRASRTILRRVSCEEIGLYSSIGIGPWRIIRQQPFGNEPLPLMVVPSSDRK